MTTAEHKFKQGSSGFVIKDEFSALEPFNIVGATAQFVFRTPEGETNTVRSASFTTDSTDETAAEQITFSRMVGADASLDVGVYIFEWKLTLADGSVLMFPVDGATDDYPERVTYSFEIVAALSAADEASEEPAPTRLLEWAMSEDYIFTSVTYDSDDVVTTAAVLWPDGSVGVFTTTTKNSTFLTVDAYTITHTDSGKTVTQSAVTRNSDGFVTATPAPTIS